MVICDFEKNATREVAIFTVYGKKKNDGKVENIEKAEKSLQGETSVTFIWPLLSARHKSRQAPIPQSSWLLTLHFQPTAKPSVSNILQLTLPFVACPTHCLNSPHTFSKKSVSNPAVIMCLSYKNQNDIF